MGQYYKPINLETRNYVYSHSFNDGLKLMEHSWMKNEMVMFVESLIAEGGAWFGKPLVWAGDYADKEKDSTHNLYQLVNGEVTPDAGYKTKHYRYIINKTKKCFVDKTNVPEDNVGWQIHPLPLLTCEGNGEGGGDFFGTDNNSLVGSWARDIITVSHEKPNEKYTELIFDLVE